MDQNHPAQYRRDGQRYASDLRAAEWEQIAPLLPPARRLGRPRRWGLRVIVEAIFYLSWAGCPWRALPKEFPPYSTVQGYFYRWRDDGTWERISLALTARARQAAGRGAIPSAGIIDSQSVPTTESGGPRGVDAGKRIKGRKRHIVTDTQGFLLAVQVHPANIQDPHGAVPLLRSLRQTFPDLTHLFADRIYRGTQLQQAVADCGPWTIQIVERPPGAKASNSCRGDGWSSAPSPGSAAADASPKTSRLPSPAPPPGSCSPTCASSPGDWQELDPSGHFMSQTLRMTMVMG